jgi:hypothetical protein
MAQKTAWQAAGLAVGKKAGTRADSGSRCRRAAEEEGAGASRGTMLVYLRKRSRFVHVNRC